MWRATTKSRWRSRRESERHEVGHEQNYPTVGREWSEEMTRKTLECLEVELVNRGPGASRRGAGEAAVATREAGGSHGANGGRVIELEAVRRARAEGEIPWRILVNGRATVDLNARVPEDRALLERFAVRYFRDEIGESWTLHLADLPGAQHYISAGKLSRGEHHTVHLFFDPPVEYEPFPF